MDTRQIPKIRAERRERTGSRYAERLRQAGRLPAVIYGHKQDPVHVSVDQKELTDLLHNHAHVLEVSTGDLDESCLIRDIQWDHLGSEIIHVDLTRVDMSETVTVEVDLSVTGEPVGLKESGAYLDHPQATLEVECRVTEIPDQLTVDVSGLDVDGQITVADLTLPAGVKAVTDPDTIVAAVRVSVPVEEEELEVAEAMEEPEVIGRGEEEGEGGEEEG